jgi:SPP1 family predicted phage head-tail adaptor
VSEKLPPIGTLTDRVQLRRRMTSPEPEGGLATIYVPTGTTWARVRSLSARLAVANDARATAASHSVVLRFRTDIGPGDRILYRGRTLEVVSANDLNGRRAYLALTCNETEFTA